MEFSVNYMAVAAAAIINMALGFVWYGPLFGKPWMKMVGLTDKDMEKAKKGGMAYMGKFYAGAFVGALVMAYVLAHFTQVGGAMSVMEGATIGFWVWLGFIATTTLSGLLWESKPLNLYLLNNGYYLVLLLVNGALLATWR